MLDEELDGDREFDEQRVALVEGHLHGHALEQETRAVADGLYSREEPYEGAAEALNQLHDAGWNVIMATSRADDWRGESQRWLHRNGFQFDGYYNGDKTLLTPDVLIDDRPVTLEAMTAKGVTVLHPDHAYCTAAPGRMFHRWAAVPLILGGLE